MAISKNTDATDPLQTFSYDAWNRLISARQEVAWPDLWNSLICSYNGLNWRVKEDRTVYAPDGASTQTQRWEFYSAQWQQLMEIIHTVGRTALVNAQEQQFWGARGPDDALYRRLDHTGTGVYDDAFYQLTDSSSSVVAHLDTAGNIRQWMSYDAYGAMKVLLPGDFDGDGRVTNADIDQMAAAMSQSAPTADINGDGVLDSKDKDLFYQYWNAGINNKPVPDEVRIGYAGYVHDPVTGYSLARNRWYDPSIGRWLTRDPAGYVDGMSMYLYARGNPLGLTDPSGLLPPDGRMMDNFITSHSPEANRLANAYWDKNGKDGAAAIDSALAAMNTPAGHRVMGGIQCAGGVCETVAGGVGAFVSAPNIAGAVVCAGVAAHGIDNIVAGGRTVCDGQLHETATHFLTAEAAKGLGASEGASNFIGTVADIGVGAGGLAAVSRITKGAASVTAIASEVNAATKPMMAASEASPLAIARYGEMSKDTTLVGQAHHLNQAAAYSDVIPHNAGMAIKLQGNILKDVGAPHTLAHVSLEDFWSPFRASATVPTNLQYTQAMQRSLRLAGLPESQVQQAVRASIAERVQYGLLGGMGVPRVPRPIQNLAK